MVDTDSLIIFLLLSMLIPKFYKSYGEGLPQKVWLAGLPYLFVSSSVSTYFDLIVLVLSCISLFFCSVSLSWCLLDGVGF